MTRGPFFQGAGAPSFRSTVDGPSMRLPQATDASAALRLVPPPAPRPFAAAGLAASLALHGLLLAWLAREAAPPFPSDGEPTAVELELVDASALDGAAASPAPPGPAADAPAEPPAPSPPEASVDLERLEPPAPVDMAGMQAPDAPAPAETTEPQPERPPETAESAPEPPSVGVAAAPTPPEPPAVAGEVATSPAEPEALPEAAEAAPARNPAEPGDSPLPRQPVGRTAPSRLPPALAARPRTPPPPVPSATARPEPPPPPREPKRDRPPDTAQSPLRPPSLADKSQPPPPNLILRRPAERPVSKDGSRNSPDPGALRDALRSSSLGRPKAGPEGRAPQDEVRGLSVRSRPGSQAAVARIEPREPTPRPAEARPPSRPGSASFPRGETARAPGSAGTERAGIADHSSRSGRPADGSAETGVASAGSARSATAPPRQARAGLEAAPGVTSPPAAASAMSGSAYGSLVNAELNRRKRYPAMAQAMGIEGSVGVSFTVGASGRVVSHAITRPSGHASLDESVRSLMASVSFPPPPGGVFPYSTSIRFRLE